MLAAQVFFFLLLPHALGSASNAAVQVLLCVILFSTLLYNLPGGNFSRIYSSEQTSALPHFLGGLIAPLAIAAALGNESRPEQWTVHIAILLLPMAMKPTAVRSG